ncbi:MAG: FimB/Mfa2 family fimbrial subunit [Bacteroides sp.]|nr:FimB/Mfa2 family fimbrial subunit [Bacteroides sp.]
MKRLVNYILKYVAPVCLMVLFLSSCSMMSEPEQDCDPKYKVRFRFDRNMLYADAFSTQVGEVNLYVFNELGELVWKGFEDGPALSIEGYSMDLPLAPGKYRFVAWCRKRNPNASDFELEEERSPSVPGDLRIRLQREYDLSIAHSSSDIHALFHGQLDNVELPDQPGEHEVLIPLTKDTNSIRIMLVHLNGKKIDKGDFSFKITDDNGYLNHDNSILEDENIEYRAWAKREGVASMNPPVANDPHRSIQAITPLNQLTRATLTEVHSLVAEMTTSRLQTTQRPILTVTRNSDKEKIIEVPIIDYFLMVKGEYHRPMDDNEYLDRQDDYSITFFLLDDGSWYKAVVDILSWRVVLQNADL